MLCDGGIKHICAELDMPYVATLHTSGRLAVVDALGRERARKRDASVGVLS